MNHPVKKNNDGSFWISEDFYYSQTLKYDTKIEELKQIIKTLKQENDELKKENINLKKEIVKRLSIIGG